MGSSYETLQSEPEDSRFQLIGTSCETPEEYRPGGLHPVLLGDTLNNRYRIVRKLGYGSYATVWLAEDKLASRRVVLKIARADLTMSCATKEISFYEALAQKPDLDAQYIASLLDSSQFHGPNRVHVCLVLEPMGPDLYSMLRFSPKYRTGQPWDPYRFPVPLTKRILRNTLRGLRYLHSNNVVHSDLHHRNILFTLSHLDAVSLEELEQREAQGTPLKRKDGKIEKWAPRYLLEGKPLIDYTDLDAEPIVKIADFGSAFKDSLPPLKVSMPAALRAPEVILGLPFGKSLDIWCFGCLVFELLTDKKLIQTYQLEGDSFDELAIDEHLIQLWEILGPLPAEFRAKWRRASEYYGSNGERLRKISGDDLDSETAVDDLRPSNEGDDMASHDSEMDLEDLEDDASFGTIPIAEPVDYDSLEKTFETSRPAEVGDEEAKLLLDMIRRTLSYEPRKRPTVEDLLNHKWFQM